MSFKSRLDKLEAQHPAPEIDFALTERLKRAHARLGLEPIEGFEYTQPRCDPAKLIRAAEIRLEKAQAEQEQETKDQQTRIIICGPQGCVEG